MEIWCFTMLLQTLLVALITGSHIHTLYSTNPSTKYHEPHGVCNVSGGVTGSSPQYSLSVLLLHTYGYWGGNYSFNNSSSAGVGVRVYASFYAGWYASMENI